MNAYRNSMRYRALKHGSEEEYDMFEDIAICRARNRRMHSAADSRLQLQPITPVSTGEDGDDTAAITHHTRRDANEHSIPEDSSICAEDGKRSQEKDTNANILNTAAKKEVIESNLVGHPHVHDHLCTNEQPDPSTSSNSSAHDPSEECSKEDGVWQTCCLQ